MTQKFGEGSVWEVNPRLEIATPSPRSSPSISERTECKTPRSVHTIKDLGERAHEQDGGKHEASGVSGSEGGHKTEAWSCCASCLLPSAKNKSGASRSLAEGQAIAFIVHGAVITQGGRSYSPMRDLRPDNPRRVGAVSLIGASNRLRDGSRGKGEACERLATTH
jgi:hypothetical protein